MSIVCLCGSTKFEQVFRWVAFRETMAGNTVLSIPFNLRTDCLDEDTSDPVVKSMVKKLVDESHKRRIDLSDEILVINVGGYIGYSTRSEIEYAEVKGKRVRFLSSE